MCSCILVMCVAVLCMYVYACIPPLSQVRTALPTDLRFILKSINSSRGSVRADEDRYRHDFSGNKFNKPGAHPQPAVGAHLV